MNTSAADLHSRYGPCDGFGRGGVCSECEFLRIERLVATLSDPDTRRAVCRCPTPEAERYNCTTFHREYDHPCSEGCSCGCHKPAPAPEANQQTAGYLAEIKRQGAVQRAPAPEAERCGAPDGVDPERRCGLDIGHGGPHERECRASRRECKPAPAPPPSGEIPEGMYAQLIRERDEALAEVERLQEERTADLCENGHHTHAECSEACSCVGLGKSRIEKAEAERDALARIVEEAPHGNICRAIPTLLAFDKWVHGPCDCWKAKALAKEVTKAYGNSQSC